MAKGNFSISFMITGDDKTVEQAGRRLDNRLAGRVKDIVAQALEGLDFDLQEHYHFFSPEREESSGIERPREIQSIPIWSAETHAFVDVQVGSPEWFGLIEKQGRFYYRFDDIRFTVRLEARQVKGKTYNYWRAYATINRKLVAKMLGTTENLTEESLDAAGAHFLKRRREKRARRKG